MKKIVALVLIALAALVAVPSQAQIKFGIKGGVNISSANFDNVPNNFSYDKISGIHIGPMLEVMIPVIGLGVDASILYSQKGLGVNTKNIKNDYIDVPVNLKWKFGLPIIKVYVVAGPYVGFRIGGDKVWDIPNIISTQLEAKNFNAGLNFGAGIELIKHLQVGATYGLGLTEDYSVSKLNMNGKNRGWSITAAVLF